MLRKVRVECPHCRLVSELHLGTEAPIVVIRCPSCATALLVLGSESIVLTDDEMSRIRHGDGDAVIQSIVDERGYDGAVPAGFAREPTLRRSDSGSGDDMRGIRVVDYDDVLDLYAQLQICRDADEFIRKIN